MYILTKTYYFYFLVLVNQVVDGRSILALAAVIIST